VYEPFTSLRPRGLRRRSLAQGAVFWRIDSQEPGDWSWAGFPTPRNRFDPDDGSFRVRYAAMTAVGAFRERYLASGRYIPTDHADHSLVRLELVQAARVLDLRTEANLDALGVDDRISTGREVEVLRACHQLSMAMRDWWPDVDGLLYRSRTTPETSANLAFFSLGAMAATGRPLRTCLVELDELVLLHEFTIGFDY
jgi:RES domain